MRSRTPVIDLYRPVVHAFCRAYFGLRLRGTEHIPSDGGLIIVPNHQTYADPPLVTIPVRRPVYYMAWSRLFDIPVFNRLIRLLRAFPVDIESDNVGGPSAGFIFALGILDAVTDGDLTRGYYVAGTGTIAADGTVGAVGGAAEKALAAELDGAQVFLVPKDDSDEARRWVHTIQIVPVERFDDAIHALCALPPLPTEAAPEPPTPCG